MLLYMLRENVINLVMTGDRLFLAIRWVDIDIMPTAMAMETAAQRFKLPDKLRALHKAISLV
jgi:hypothetical protein